MRIFWRCGVGELKNVVGYPCVVGAGAIQRSARFSFSQMIAGILWESTLLSSAQS